MFLLVLIQHLTAIECDRMFISNPDGLKNGSFSSPTFENEQRHSRQCIFTFIAAENERVQISFSLFNLRGTTPDCSGEYVDLYTELEDPGQDLINTPFGGRYCGRTVPRKRISMYQTLVFGFYTDQKIVDDQVFQGNYEFIDASAFIAGTPAPHRICSYSIYSDQKREGQLLSPTYPGVYPKNLNCQYQFLGRKGQRVRLEFMDFDLFYGGPHCPFDFIKVYDGASEEDPLIATYCGQQRNLMVYSSGENLFVQFTTLKRTADSQNRGFSGWFEFSERFVNLGFIGKNDGEHIRGTECDQKILSHKESNGTVYSPNYPFLYHSNIVCKYYIYGLQDSQHLERVNLEFEKFEIPATDPNECTDAYVRLYTQSHALDEFDYVFCGPTLPPHVLSEGPSLVIVFSSGSTQGQGFKAKYTFETDYKVPGTPASTGQCHFSYVSESTKQGDINSPRHPSNYPSSTHCIYEFFGKTGEQVKLVFNHFKINPEKLVAGYNDVCQEDWLEIYEIHSSGREIKFGKYCSVTTPGPIITDFGVNKMKIILNTDESGVSSGFSATYHFIDAISSFGDCGSNITGLENGIITSPNYPNGYLNHRQVCNWYITVRPRFKVLFHFETFLVEGDPKVRGCSGAVVRVWLDLSQQPVELCGSELSNETSELISTTNMLKITFITAQKAVGAKGFKASWTEIREPGSSCDQFKCASSGYCVSSNLHCNAIKNCGNNDQSDEMNCTQKPEINIIMIVGAVSAASLLFIIIICSLCHRKRKRRRSNSSLTAQFEISRPKPPQFEIPPGMHFLHIDSV